MTGIFSTKSRYDTNDYVVYLHRNPISDNIFYVGMGTIIRAKQFSSKVRSPRWGSYVKKYGRPKVEVYKSNLFEHEAVYLESHLIKSIKTKENGGTLINFSPGGYNPNTGRIYSDEFKKRLSEIHKGKPKSKEHCEAISRGTMGEKHHRWGKKMSQESRNRMSIAKKGKVISEEAKKRIIEVGFQFRFGAKKIIHNPTGKVFNSITEAGNYAGIDMKLVSLYLRGRIKSKINEYSYLA